MRVLLRSIQFLAIAAWAVSLASATTGCGGGGSDGGACCKTCSTGKACGDSCISRDYECDKGNGCACDAALALNPKPGAPIVEVFTYIGPTGLRYGEGAVSGVIDVSPASLEVEIGKTAPLYWENVYLGELVPSPENDLVYFDTDLQGSSCNALAREFVSALVLLKGNNGATASLKDLESMGFPDVKSIREARTITELGAHSKVLSNFGSGLEKYAGCK